MIHRKHVTIRTLTVLSFLALAAPVAASPSKPGGLDTASRGEVTSPLQTPTPNLLFIQNVGQWPDAARFQMRTGNQTWWFTDDIPYANHFTVTPGAFDTIANGLDDGFVAHFRLGPGQALHATIIDPFYRPSGENYMVGTDVTVQDNSGQPVPGAVVFLRVTLPEGQTFPVALVTHNDGTGQHSGIVSASGTYTFTVASVIKRGWAYDPAQNVETSDSISVPQMPDSQNR